jgi:hypothetical protein
LGEEYSLERLEAGDDAEGAAVAATGVVCVPGDVSPLFAPQHMLLHGASAGDSDDDDDGRLSDSPNEFGMADENDLAALGRSAPSTSAPASLLPPPPLPLALGLELHPPQFKRCCQAKQGRPKPNAIASPSDLPVLSMESQADKKLRPPGKKRYDQRRRNAARSKARLLADWNFKLLRHAVRPGVLRLIKDISTVLTGFSIKDLNHARGAYIATRMIPEAVNPELEKVLKEGFRLWNWDGR